MQCDDLMRSCRSAAIGNGGAADSAGYGSEEAGCERDISGRRIGCGEAAGQLANEEHDAQRRCEKLDGDTYDEER